MSANKEPESSSADEPTATFGAKAAKWTPILLTILFALYALSKLRPPANEGAFDYSSFGALPAQMKGRVKPLDTIARNALLVMRGKQTVPDGPEISFAEKVFHGKQAPRYLPAIEWFARLTLGDKPDETKADDLKVFRIDHPEVLGLFGFKPGQAKYFSFNDLFLADEIAMHRAKLDSINDEVKAFLRDKPDATEAERADLRDRLIPLSEKAQEVLNEKIAKVTKVEKVIRSIKLGEDLNRNGALDAGEDLNQNGKLDPGPNPKKFTPYQRKLGDLYEAVTLYDQLKNVFFPIARPDLFDPGYENDLTVLELRKKLIAEGALQNENIMLRYMEENPDLLQRLDRFRAGDPFLQAQARFAPMGIIPPKDFNGTVSIAQTDNDVNATLTAKNGNLATFLKAQDQVKIGTFSTFRGIWRENQLREKLIKSVDSPTSAGLTNRHEGRSVLIDTAAYLSILALAYGLFRSLRKKRGNNAAGVSAGIVAASLAFGWVILFGKPDASIENATLHHIDWTTLPDSLLQTRGQAENAAPENVGLLNSYVETYAALASAHQTGQAVEFNKITADLDQDFAGVAQAQWHDFKNLGPEHLFNGVQPFVTCMALYLTSLILVFFSWLFWPEPLRKSALGIAAVALVLHTVALLLRIWIQGRPPVTNLYSSAIFISWGSVCFGLLFERLHRNGIGAASAAVVGFVSLLIAHGLAMDGDTMEMLQAVLDTNLWLATHVVAITLGYVAMFVAGVLGILYVLRGILDRNFDKTTARSINSMIYGVTCFAVLFSFVGTMLGGIWADQSWGRFWGWDPKENGALIIVIWSAIVLHSRWGGFAKERGIAALSIFGNIVTAWSWFGTNLLQEGLHSYGFSDAGFQWLMRFIALQLLLIGLAYFPLKLWRSELGQTARAA